MQNTANLQQSSKIKWAFTALVIIVTWFALVLQFSISMQAYLTEGRSPGNAMVQFFSYYTILSNLLMVVALTAIFVAPKSVWGKFFLKGTVLTGIALYITIVALIYNILLRNLWHMEGLFKLANELLHVVDPVLFIIYWVAFVPKGELRYKDVLPWLWFPFLYFIYVLIRGAIGDEYPYPFLNVAKAGYTQVMLNALMLLPIIWGLGALYVFIGSRLSKTGN